MCAPRQADRARDRSGLRLHRRPHVRRQRHVLRPHDGARLPADDVADRRHGHLPRRRAPLGRRRSGTLSSATSTCTRCAWLLLGSIPGILISSRYTVRVPHTTIRLGLGGILIISGLNLLDMNESLPTGSLPCSSARSRSRSRSTRSSRCAAPRAAARTRLTRSLVRSPVESARLCSGFSRRSSSWACSWPPLPLSRSPST